MQRFEDDGRESGVLSRLADCFFVQLAIALSTRPDCSTSSQSTGHAKSSSGRDGIDSMRDTVPEEEEDDEEEDKDDEGEDIDDEEEKEEDDKEDEETKNADGGRSFPALILSAVASCRLGDCDRDSVKRIVKMRTRRKDFDFVTSRQGIAQRSGRLLLVTLAKREARHCDCNCASVIVEMRRNETKKRKMTEAETGRSSLVGRRGNAEKIHKQEADEQAREHKSVRRTQTNQRRSNKHTVP